jgi:hypothetical protein
MLIYLVLSIYFWAVSDSLKIMSALFYMACMYIYMYMYMRVCVCFLTE